MRYTLMAAKTPPRAAFETPHQWRTIYPVPGAAPQTQQRKPEEEASPVIAQGIPKRRRQGFRKAA